MRAKKVWSTSCKHSISRDSMNPITTLWRKGNIPLYSIVNGRRVCQGWGACTSKGRIKCHPDEQASTLTSFPWQVFFARGDRKSWHVFPWQVSLFKYRYICASVTLADPQAIQATGFGLTHVNLFVFILLNTFKNTLYLQSGMPTFQQGDWLSRKNLANFSIQTSKQNLSRKTCQGGSLLVWTALNSGLKKKSSNLNEINSHRLAYARLWRARQSLPIPSRQSSRQRI